MDHLDGLRRCAGPYPSNLLKGCETALLLFGAGFLGMNDGIHMVDAGISAVVVDIDESKLLKMANLYPDDWTFVKADAWWMAERLDSTFDVVSVDNFTGDSEAPVLASLGLWCRLANRLVTVTKTAKNLPHSIPYGWEPGIVARSSRANWLVLTR